MRELTVTMALVFRCQVVVAKYCYVLSQILILMAAVTALIVGYKYLGFATIAFPGILIWVPMYYYSRERIIKLEYRGY